jgi:hypothetical protein
MLLVEEDVTKFGSFSEEISHLPDYFGFVELVGKGEQEDETYQHCFLHLNRFIIDYKQITFLTQGVPNFRSDCSESASYC